MSLMQMITVALLLLALVLALFRLLLGPSTADRILASDALAVTATPLIAFLGFWLGSPFYLDIALVYGALGFVGVVAMARVLEARG